MRISNQRLVNNDGRMVDWVASPNIGSKLSDGGRPTTLVMHYTAGGSASSTVSYFKDPSSRVSAHLVIGRNGHITQMVKFDTVGWHAGTSRWRGLTGVNRFSIGIEIANYGKLQQADGGDWVSWSGNVVPSNRVIVDEHKHFPGQNHGWEIFDEPQMSAAIGAAQAIVAEYSLQPWDVVGHEDVSIHRKIDPGPVFDMDRFRERVFGRSEDTWSNVLYKVVSSSGLNLRNAPDVSGKLIENMPDGTKVHVIEKPGNWWLVAKIVNNNEDVTGYAHRNWLVPD